MMRCSIVIASIGFIAACANQTESVQNSEALELNRFEFGSLNAGAGISLVDLDGNGADEIVVAVAQQSRNSVFTFNQGEWLSAEFQELTDQDDSVSATCWADFNSDGKIDTYLARQNGEENALLANQDKPGFVVTSSPSNLGDNYDCAWGDLNADGWPDLVVLNFSGDFELLENLSGTGFEPFEISGLPEGDRAQPTGSGTFVDYDGDGDQDVFITRPGATNLMLRNQGGVYLTPVAAEDIGELANASALWASSSWMDFDNDGDLDVFITRLDGANTLFENSGGKFKASGQPAFSRTAQSWVGAWGDIDNDGYPDLYVTNYESPDELFLGSETGIFELFDSSILGDQNRPSSGAAMGDLDADGDLDLAVANWEHFQNEVIYSNGNQLGNWIQIDLHGSILTSSTFGAKVSVETVSNGRQTTQMQEFSQASGLRSQSSAMLHFGVGEAQKAEILIAWPDGSVERIEDAKVNRRYNIIKPYP